MLGKYVGEEVEQSVFAFGSCLALPVSYLFMLWRKEVSGHRTLGNISLSRLRLLFYFVMFFYSYLKITYLPVILI